MRVHSRGSSLLPALLLALGALALLGARCGGGPTTQVRIDSPADGSFATAANVTVAGTVTGIGGVGVADVTVNGVSVLPLAPDGAFSVSVPMDTVAVFNPVVAELWLEGASTPRRDRITLIAGDGLTSGPIGETQLASEAVALRLNDRGLDAVEPHVTSLVGSDLDLGSLLPPGTLVTEFDAGFLGSADVVIVDPPPTYSSFGLAVDSMDAAVAGDILINDAQVNLFIDGSGIVPNCDLTVRADTTNILGDYDLAPDAAVPTQVDVDQLGGVSVVFGSFQEEFTSGLCDFPLLGDLIQAIIGDIEPMVRSGLQDFLADPDGSGPVDAPVADAIETALAGIDIAGNLGTSIGVVLEAPLSDVPEDVDGLTLSASSRITPLMPDPAAPDFSASYAVEAAPPSFGATSPSGAPYGLALAISPTAFNQLLKAEVESGLLARDLTEVELSGTTVPLTAGALSLFVPEFGSFPSSQPLVLEIQPRLAPVFTGRPGPAGELAELRLGDLRAAIHGPGDTTDMLAMRVNARVGVDVTFSGGSLAFALGEPDPADVDVDITANAVHTDEQSLSTLLPQVVGMVLPSLSDSLGSFPIPAFFGLELAPVEVTSSGDFLVLYADLVAAP